MILKSFIVEKNIALLEQYFATLVYGENIGMKDDIKNDIKEYFKEYEPINFDQDEIIKNGRILNEQIDNTSLFSKKKIIFINEISDKIKDKISEILEKPKPDVKIFLFAHNLEKKLFIRTIFEKEKELAIIPCYQDNERSLSEYLRKKLNGYSGLSQQSINFLIDNAGLDRKTLSYEIDKIKSLFLDKKIKFEKLLEVLNSANNLDFNDIRDNCLGAEKEKLNKNLGNVILQNEEAYFYLSILGNRIEKLSVINDGCKNINDAEKVIDSLRPPIFWKDKPTFYKQIKKWDTRKLKEAKKMLFDTEILIKTKTNMNNNTLIRNLIVKLCYKAASTY